MAKYTITIEDREDGGLRVSSDDIAGLILSGPDKEKVLADMAVVIPVLMRRTKAAGWKKRKLQLPENVSKLSDRRRPPAS